jgi:hypothetical protein
VEQQQEQQQQQQQSLRVLVVPEADSYVAAVLLHWLYTDELPARIPAGCCGLQTSYGQVAPCNHQQQQQQRLHHHQQQHGKEVGEDEEQWKAVPVSLSKRHAGNGGNSEEPAAEYKQQQQQQQEQQSCCDCCDACHAVRVLLRLWHCCELLLLPQLQQQCLAEVQLQLQQLPGSCCLVLLQDCVSLGVAEAAEGLWRRLLTMYADQGECLARWGVGFQVM